MAAPKAHTTTTSSKAKTSKVSKAKTTSKAKTAAQPAKFKAPAKKPSKHGTTASAHQTHQA